MPRPVSSSPTALPPPAPDAALSARDRILRAAHDLFYRDGVRATGIDRVIAEAQVTKVTFYRHFPSKNELVLAYLAHRHGAWMDWFIDALVRHGALHPAPDLAVLVPVLGEWFKGGAYRGCAFINVAAELGMAFPAALELARRHKADMVEAVRVLLPDGPAGARAAAAVALVLDGAMVRAQLDDSPEASLQALADALLVFSRPSRA